MSSLIFTVTHFLAVFIFAFIIWKKLREDYPNELIFSFTLALLASGSSGWWIFQKFATPFAFWGVFVLPVILGLYFVKKFDMRPFEVIDAVAVSWFWFAFLGTAGSLLATLQMPSILSLPQVLIPLVSLGMYSFFIRNYRSFSWYPSGKVGFAGIASLALYFLLFAVFSLYQVVWHSLNREALNSIIGLVLFLSLSAAILIRSRN